jgi:hypothetical protein
MCMAGKDGRGGVRTRCGEGRGGEHARYTGYLPIPWLFPCQEIKWRRPHITPPAHAHDGSSPYGPRQLSTGSQHLFPSSSHTLLFLDISLSLLLLPYPFAPFRTCLQGRALCRSRHGHRCPRPRRCPPRPLLGQPPLPCAAPQPLACTDWMEHWSGLSG